MDVLPYEPSMAPQLAAAYNSQVRGLPHCYPVSAEAFASAVSPGPGDDEMHARLHSQSASVAAEGAAIVGLVDVAVEGPEEGEEKGEGLIRFMWYERGHRAAGQALLVAAEDYFRQRKLDKVKAFWQDYRYRFYHVEHAHLSDRLDHVHALLGFNGYERMVGEVYLDWPDYGPLVPAAPEVCADISLSWKPGRGARPGLDVIAHRDEKWTGICHSVSGGEFSDADDAQDWFLTCWLHVAEEVQGKGLGRHLLQRALQEMHDIGYRHAAISTSSENFRAMLFYGNCGYRVVDWTYALGRTLGDA